MPVAAVANLRARPRFLRAPAATLIWWTKPSDHSRLLLTYNNNLDEVDQNRAGFRLTINQRR